MSASFAINIYDSLGLPAEAFVGRRIPKALLLENGVRTSADRRAIQDGIEELQWLAVCKPAIIGVPAFSDGTREYLEIAVVACAFRTGAKSGRLIELIHRAIPYPVVLITTDESCLTVSAAHKRHAQNEDGRTVIDRVVAASDLQLGAEDASEAAFLKSLPLAQQPRSDLYALYAGWFARIEALNAARLTGEFVATDDSTAIGQRREALDAHEQLTNEIDILRGKARREKQLKRRVNLNMEIQRREADLADYKKNL